MDKPTSASDPVSLTGPTSAMYPYGASTRSGASLQIFVSFSGEDSDSAERVAQALRQGGHDVICTAEGGREGAAHHVQLREELNESDLLVFLASEHSLEDGAFTLTELGWAKTKWRNPDNHVLVVLLDGVDRGKLPAYVSGVGHLEPEGNLEAEVATVAERMLSSQTTYKSATATAAWKRRLMMLLCVGIGFAAGYFVAGLESEPRSSGATPAVEISDPLLTGELYQEADKMKLSLQAGAINLLQHQLDTFEEIPTKEPARLEQRLFETGPCAEPMASVRLVGSVDGPTMTFKGVAAYVVGSEGASLRPVDTRIDSKGKLSFTALIPRIELGERILIIANMLVGELQYKPKARDFDWEYQWDTSD